jgi:hypothetical protein
MVQRHELLKNLHELLEPRNYLEIGVHLGLSMTLSRCRSIGIDPAFKVTQELQCDVHLVRATSDEFFARKHPLAHFDEPVIDLAFIDGMHLSEYALRDYMNVERFSRSSTVIVFDDMLPGSDREAARDRRGAGLMRGRWAGDVYKVIEALRVHRPDVVCLEVDTEPTGTAVILLPDPSATGLVDHYDELVRDYVTPDPQQVPSEILTRSRAVDPEKLLASSLWEELRGVRDLDDAVARPLARKAVEQSGFAQLRA